MDFGIVALALITCHFGIRHTSVNSGAYGLLRCQDILCSRGGEWPASVIFAGGWRRQARICARLAEDREDQHLAERLKLMADNLPAKSDEVEELALAA
jgi:hypothetical protein